MNKIKVLLSSRPKLLSDVIRNIIQQQEDMQLVDVVVDPLALLNSEKTATVDVVIVTPFANEKKPKICYHLLAAYPKLKVATLSANGEAAYLYQANAASQRINDPSIQSLLSSIRKAVLTNPM